MNNTGIQSAKRESPRFGLQSRAQQARSAALPTSVYGNSLGIIK